MIDIWLTIYSVNGLQGVFYQFAICVSNVRFTPLHPHDALKHHFRSLKTDLFFLQPRVLERTNERLQVENCDSNSRLVVDEDDNGKFRLEKGKVKIFVNINYIVKS